MEKVRPGSLPFPQFGDQPLECLRCGYDLRGLTRPEHCPECGCVVGAADGSEVLLTAGVPRTEFGHPARKYLTFIVVLGWVLLTQPAVWLLSMALFRGIWAPAVALLGLIAATVGLLVTGPRRATATERVVFSRGGIGRCAWRSWKHVGFVEWNGHEIVQMKSISSVWQKLVIRRPTENGTWEKVLEYGFRCRREHVGLVKAVIESMALGTALPERAHELLATETRDRAPS